MEPFVFDDAAFEALQDGESGFPFPDMTGDDLSPEWEETDQEWFVDSSGFGNEKESALTAEAFRQQIIAYIREHPDHGFGLSGIGQFQVYVQAYRLVEESCIAQ